MAVPRDQTDPTGDNRLESPESGRVHCWCTWGRAYFLDSSRDVLNEQLAKVVEGLEFTGLWGMMQTW